MGETIIIRNSRSNPVNAIRGERGSSVKERQLAVILSSNPADDANRSYHTWIREVGDIHTFQEAMALDGYTENDDFTPDFKASDVKDALRSGNVTVYSSHPIRNGVFVTPSRMEAQSYAGGGRVYSQKVRLSDVAWIDGLQGQLAKTKTVK